MRRRCRCRAWSTRLPCKARNHGLTTMALVFLTRWTWWGLRIIRTCPLRTRFRRPCLIVRSHWTASDPPPFWIIRRTIMTILSINFWIPIRRRSHPFEKAIRSKRNEKKKKKDRTKQKKKFSSHDIFWIRCMMWYMYTLHVSFFLFWSSEGGFDFIFWFNCTESFHFFFGKPWCQGVGNQTTNKWDLGVRDMILLLLCFGLLGWRDFFSFYECMVLYNSTQ